MNEDIFTLSDAVLILCLAVGVTFSLGFALGKPRVWFKDPLGWVIFLYSLSVNALLFLIVYSIVFGQKVDEVYRASIAIALLCSLVSKAYLMFKERANGRQAGARAAASATLLPEEGADR